jgi:hypothetical protein
MYINLTVLGGLAIEFWHDGDEWFIVTVAGRSRKQKHLRWIYARIEASIRDITAIHEAIREFDGV